MMVKDSGAGMTRSASVVARVKDVVLTAIGAEAATFLAVNDTKTTSSSTVVRSGSILVSVMSIPSALFEDGFTSVLASDVALESFEGLVPASSKEAAAVDVAHAAERPKLTATIGSRATVRSRRDGRALEEALRMMAGECHLTV